MYNLSVREKKLLVILAGLVAFALWFKTFFGTLLPHYHQIQQQIEQATTLEQKLSKLIAEITVKENLIKQIQSEVKHIQYQFTSDVGFLLYTIGKLAEGKVTILEVDTNNIGNESYFQTNSLSIAVMGHYQEVMDFIQDMENLSGINLNKIELIGVNDEHPGMVHARITVHHYDFYSKEIFSAEPGFQYEPYINSNPFETSWDNSEETISGIADNTQLPEEPLTQESGSTSQWPLAPYTFPVR